MEYRIREVEENGKRWFYPQWKKRWLWRRFVWWGGEDGTTPYTVFYKDKSSAIAHIEGDKNMRIQKANIKPKEIKYHYID